MDDQSFRSARAVLQAACAVLLRARIRGLSHAEPMMILGLMPTPPAVKKVISKYTEIGDESLNNTVFKL